MLSLLEIPEFRAAWGLDDKEELSLDDLASVMGISRQTLQRVEESALRKIRRALMDDPESLAVLQAIYFQSRKNNNIQ